MNKNLSFYNCDSEQFAPKGVERTEVLKNISRQDFISKHIDPLFNEYLEELIQTPQESRSIEDEREQNFRLRRLETLATIQSIFSKSSFGKLICDLESDSINSIIPEYNKPLSEEQIIKLIGRLQFFIDNFLNKKDITNFYLQKNHISDSPYGYGCYVLLNDIGKQVEIGLTYNEYDNYTRIAHNLSAFFTSFLANIFFRKTKERIEEEKKDELLFNLGMELGSYMNIYYGIFDSIKDRDERASYIQALYNLQNNSTEILDEHNAQEIIDLTSEYIDSFGKNEQIGPLSQEEQLEIVQDNFKKIFNNFFASVVPNKGDEISVDLVTIGSKKELLSKNNFYFDTIDVEFLVDEIEKIEAALGGKMGYMDTKYRSKDYTQLIREANLFDALGNKVRRGDFNTNSNFSELAGTYYVLTQRDGYFIHDDAVVEDREVIPDNNRLKFRFGLFTDDYDFTQPTLVESNYVRSKAKYKIQNGKLIPNTFL